MIFYGNRSWSKEIREGVRSILEPAGHKLHIPKIMPTTKEEIELIQQGRDERDCEWLAKIDELILDSKKHYDSANMYANGRSDALRELKQQMENEKA